MTRINDYFYKNDLMGLTTDLIRSHPLLSITDYELELIKDENVLYTTILVIFL